MKTLPCTIGLILITWFVSGCSGCSSNNDTSYLDDAYQYAPDTDYSAETGYASDDYSIKITYTEMRGNTITIPVRINGLLLDMIFDTGASSTCISLAEAEYLYSKGMLTDRDIVDVQQFQTADGNISVGLRIILREVIIGSKINLRDIEAIVVQSQQAPLLLGQSVMKQFREISVDRENKLVKFFE